MERLTQRSIAIAGPAGELEALVDEPQRRPRAVAVICHPHPLHHGTMHNKVVHTLARAFRDLGAAAVRFNFRGVGASVGTYDRGRGERQDAVAVAAWAAERWRDAALILGGFSFGAATAYLIAERIRARALVTVALPVDRVGEQPPPDCPWLTVHGARDEIVPAAALLAWLDRLEVRPDVALIEAADHFLHGELQTLTDRVTGFVRARVAELGADDGHAA